MTEAIIGTYLTEYGITLDNAFIVIPDGTMNEIETNFNFEIYANVSSYTLGKPPIITNTYSFATDTELKNELLTKCFEFMKTLPQFSEFTEV